MPHLSRILRAAPVILVALLLGCGGRGPASVSAATSTETFSPSPAEMPTAIPVSTAVQLTVSPVTPAPTEEHTRVPTQKPTNVPTPEPTPTPSGLCGGRFPDKFSDEPISTETSYQSPELAIFLTEVYDESSFSSRVSYFVADIYVQDITLLKTAPAGKDFASLLAGSVKRMASDNRALLAVSGDYYAHSMQGLVIRNGISYQEKPSTRFESCVLFRDGTIAFYAPEALDIQALLDAGAWQGWTFGPSLLSETGAPLTTMPPAYARVVERNPRCMLGYYEPGHYCLVVVDGRQRSSGGLTLLELSQLAHDLGCTKAYNLDGGQSAQIYWQDRIFNRPVAGGRVISDIIFFAAPEAPAVP